MSRRKPHPDAAVIREVAPTPTPEIAVGPDPREQMRAAYRVAEQDQAAAEALDTEFAALRQKRLDAHAKSAKSWLRYRTLSGEIFDPGKHLPLFQAAAERARETSAANEPAPRTWLDFNGEPAPAPAAREPVLTGESIDESRPPPELRINDDEPLAGDAPAPEGWDGGMTDLPANLACAPLGTIGVSSGIRKALLTLGIATVGQFLSQWRYLERLQMRAADLIASRAKVEPDDVRAVHALVNSQIAAAEESRQTRHKPSKRPKRTAAEMRERRAERADRATKAGRDRLNSEMEHETWQRVNRAQKDAGEWGEIDPASGPEDAE